MTIEDQIRTSLTDGRRALPSWDDPAGRVHRGIRRRRRRQGAAVAAGIALVLAVPAAIALVAGHAPGTVGTPGVSTGPSASGSPSGTAAPSAPAGEVVPWLDQPGVYHSTPPTVWPTARPCTAADLSTTAGVQSDQLGVSEEDAANVTVRNTSDSRCTLSGTPGLETKTGGSWQPVPAGEGSWSDRSVTEPATIDPSQEAYVQLAKTLVCNGGTGTPQMAQNLALVVGGVRIPIPGLRLAGTCPGVFVSRWWLPVAESQAAYPGLTATAQLPATVRAGTTMRYTVALTNTTDTAIWLDPCPLYYESIYKFRPTYVLNCAPGQIGAHRTVTFAMELDVPATLEPGVQPVGWGLIDDAGFFDAQVDTQVTVVG